jgi:hypothetical protein
MIASAVLVDQDFEATEMQKIRNAFTGISRVNPDIVVLIFTIQFATGGYNNRS